MNGNKPVTIVATLEDGYGKRFTVTYTAVDDNVMDATLHCKEYVDYLLDQNDDWILIGYTIRS